VKIEYDILAAESPVNLAAAVRTHIADGWEPTGGISTSVFFERGQPYETWAQAITRRRDDSISGEHS
jgi:hypothetical protein